MGVDAEAEEPEDWTAWMKASGYDMCFRKVPARKAVETVNAFAALTSEEPDVPDPPKLVDLPKPVEDCKAATALGRFVAEPSFAEPRVGLVKEFGASRKCCSFTSSQRRYSAGSEKSPAELS